jgi:hypothetical protein
MGLDRQLIEAKLALSRIRPEEMSALAWDALEAGCDGRTVRRLAALIKPSGWEVDQIMPAFMREVGLRALSKQEASIKLARHLAHRILSNELDPVNYTRDFELLWIHADYPKEIQEAGCLDDEKYLAESMGETADQFREYARTVLAKLAES